MATWEFLSLLPSHFSFNSADVSDHFWQKEKNRHTPRYEQVELVPALHECTFKFKFSSSYIGEQKELYKQKEEKMNLLDMKKVEEIIDIFYLIFSATVKDQGFMQITFELPEEWDEKRTNRATQELRFQLYHFSKSFLREICEYENLHMGFEYKKWFTILTQKNRSMEEISDVLVRRLKIYFRERRYHLVRQRSDLTKKFGQGIYTLLFPLVIIFRRGIFDWINELYRVSVSTATIAEAQFRMVHRISENNDELKKIKFGLDQIKSLSISFVRSSNFILNALSAQVTISGLWIGIIGLTLAILVYYDIQILFWSLFLIPELVLLFRPHTIGMIKSALCLLEEEWGN